MLPDNFILPDHRMSRYCGVVKELILHIRWKVFGTVVLGWVQSADNLNQQRIQVLSVSLGQQIFISLEFDGKRVNILHFDSVRLEFIKNRVILLKQQRTVVETQLVLYDRCLRVDKVNIKLVVGKVFAKVLSLIKALHRLHEQNQVVSKKLKRLH